MKLAQEVILGDFDVFEEELGGVGLGLGDHNDLMPALENPPVRQD